jgi:hypothetical protein
MARVVTAFVTQHMPQRKNKSSQLSPAVQKSRPGGPSGANLKKTRRALFWNTAVLIT